MKLLAFYAPVHYHVLQSEIERISVQPQKEHVMEALLRVPPRAFPHLVADVLRAEGHQDVRVVDGAGDEGRDIHSVRPDGQRQLTQCKHHQNPKRRVDVEELDLMVMAALRKRYSHALLVTNTDFTAPAKKYVLDRTYQTGNVAVDMWGATEIWPRIASQPSLLDKWLSSLAQIHAVRTYRMQVIALHMPSQKPILFNDASCKHVLGALLGLAGAEGDGGRAVVIPMEGMQVRVELYFATITDFRQPTIEDLAKSKHPLWALRCQVTLDQEPFDLAATMVQVGRKLAPAFRSAVSFKEGEWFTVLTSRPTATGFIHATHTAAELFLGDGEAFVGSGSDVVREADVLVSCNDQWERVQDEDESLYFLTISGDVRCDVFMDVPRTASDFEFERMAVSAVLNDFDEYVFWSVSMDSADVVGRVRQVMPPTALMLSDRGRIVVGMHPTQYDAGTLDVDVLEDGLRRMHIPFARLGAKERRHVKAALKSHSQSVLVDRVVTTIIKSLDSWIPPADLLSRRYRYAASVPVSPSTTLTGVLPRLVQYKCQFLNDHGGTVPLEGQVPGHVILNFLADNTVIHGPVEVFMWLDEGEHKLHIQFMWQPRNLTTNAMLLDEGLVRFKAIVADVHHLCADS